MELLKKLILPTTKKLIAFAFVLFNSLFILQGVWQTDIITFDETWAWWQSVLMMFFSFTNFFGIFFQSPYFFLAQFFPERTELVVKVVDTFGIIVFAYIFGVLIGSIWESKKTLKVKHLLWVYIAVWFSFSLGIFAAYFSEPLWNFVLVIIAGLLAGLISFKIKRHAKDIFLPLVLITVLCTLGSLNVALSNFEESYCWDQQVGTSNSEFSDHMDCHKKFDLLQTLSRIYLTR